MSRISDAIDLLLVVLPLFQSRAKRSDSVVAGDSSKNQYQAFLSEAQQLQSNLNTLDVDQISYGSRLVEALRGVLRELEPLADGRVAPQGTTDSFPKLRSFQTSIARSPTSNSETRALVRTIRFGGQNQEHVKVATQLMKNSNRLLLKPTRQALPHPPTTKPRSSETTLHLNPRSRALVLFSTLSLCRSAKCRKNHAAMLQLGTYASKDVDEYPSTFSILLTECCSQGWKDCEVHVKKQAPLTAETTRQVHFGDSPPSLVRGTPAEEGEKIPDLCNWQTHVFGDVSLELLIKGRDLRYMRSLPPRVSQQSLSTMVSLDDILSQNKAKDFTLQTKRILAVLLSHALVQLVGGPWMRVEWNKEDIYFIQRQIMTTPDIFDLRGPYIFARLEPQSNAPHEELLPGSYPSIRSYHPYPTLLTLGILLLELESGVRLNLGAEDNNTKLKMALEYFEEQWDDEDIYEDGLWDVIRSCLDPKFIPQSRASDENFLRAAIQENIVEPLQAALLKLPKKVQIDELDGLIRDNKLRYLKKGRGRGIWIQNSARISLSTESIHSPLQWEASCNLPEISPVSSEANPERIGEALLEYDTAECVLFDEGSVSTDRKKRKESKNWLKKVTAVTASILSTERSEARRRVRIAILDTGIDPADPFLLGCKERIRDCRSWVDGAPQGDANVLDEFGHGTHACALLCGVAPEADIYVGRISRGKNLESPTNIAKAIRWAIACQVDMITMSFGFSNQFRDFKAFVDIINPAIDEAFGSNIIMFAAAGNGGGYVDVGYPAKSSKVIPVFSTDGFAAKKSDFSPVALENGASLAALGEDIESSWPEKLDSSHKQVKSGTSFATPLVAGFAATLLEYFRQQVPSSTREISHLKSRSGMEAVLKLMALGKKNPGTGYFDFQPWNFFYENKEEGAAILEIKLALQKDEFRS